MRGAALSGASVLVNLGIGVVLTPLLLRNLGAEAFGLLAVLVAVTAYLQLLEGGVGASTVRRLAAALADGDHLKASRVITNGFALNLAGAVLAGAATLAVAPFAATILGTSGSKASDARLGLVLVGFGQCLVLVSTSWTARTLASGRADLLAKRGAAIALASAVAQGAVVTSGGGLIAVVCVTALTAAATAVAVLPASRAALPGYAVSRQHLHRETMRDLMTDGVKQTGVALSGAVSTGLDPILISVLLGPAAVAPYALASRGVGLLRAVATRATDTLLAPFAGLSSVDDKERQYRLFRAATVGSGLLAAAGALPAVLFSRDLLRLWLGDYPARTGAVLVVLCAVLVVQLPGHVAYITLTARGDYRSLLRLGVVAVPVNVALSTIFTLWLGPVGPGVGTLCVVAVADAFILPQRVCRKLDRSPGDLLVDVAVVCLAPAIAVGGASALLVKLVGAPSGAWALVACATAAMAVIGAAWLCAGRARRLDLTGGGLRRTRTG